MHYVYNKSLAIDVSRLSFGGASLSGEGAGYGFGEISTKESINLLHKSFSCGISIVDTAPIYGFGESEVRIGKAISGRRDSVHVISKSGVSWHENMRVNMTNNPEVALKQLHESLTRLNTDYIDTYMVHWPDKNVDLLETLDVYLMAQKQGKIKHIGLCNTTNAEILKAKTHCKVDIIQSEVNLFNNQISNLDNSQSAMTMSWGTFDKGIITGSVTKDRVFDKSDCRSWAPWWKKSNWKEKVDKIEKLKDFVKDTDYSLISFALGYNLNFVDTAICGFKNEEQLDEILKAVNSLPSLTLIKKGMEYAGI
jgi:myo-inositol catabolism protein IolS